MIGNKREVIWVFIGNQAQFPCGVFFEKAAAEMAIKQYRLSGLLTAYPTDVLIYEWAIEQGYFHSKNNLHNSPAFIQRFTSASLEHYHYDDGLCVSSAEDNR